MDKTKIHELNTISGNLGVSARVKFYAGDLSGVVTTVAPYARVAVLYAKTSFSENGKTFTEILKKSGVKPLNFIMPENAALNLENVFDVIGVPDDVRAVVCFDHELINIAAYIATIFKIPFIYNLNSVNTDGVLPVKVPFYLGDGRKKADLFSVDCAFHVALDIPENGANDAEQYVNVISKMIALADYRVKLEILGGKPDKAAYDLIKDAVMKVFAKPLSGENSAFYGLVTEIANVASDGEIICNSADYCFKRLIGFKTEKGLTFALMQKILKLYALCAEKKEVPFSVPDYNERVIELAAITESDDGAFLKGLLKQRRFYKKKAGIDALKEAFCKEFFSQVNALKKAEETFIALGGKQCEDFAPHIKALKLCGDLPNTFNFMSVVRESGFSEF